MEARLQASGLTMANTPRPAADGMDSEVLRQQDLKYASHQPKHLRISPPSGSRHRNLNTSPSSTTFSKASSAVYIPYEPVKGAVKAVLQTPTSSASFRSNVSNLGTNADKLNSRLGNKDINTTVKQTSKFEQNSPTKLSLSENRISYDYPIKPQMTIAQAVASKTSVTNATPSTTKELVKAIQVPFYNAPSHLSVKTYQTMENYQKNQLDKETNKTTISDPRDDHVVLNMSPLKAEPTPEVSLTLDTESRSVEGQVTLPTDLLTKEVENLKDQLHVQTKVNGELKKLLVASMGDDLHYRVECLVRTNAQLAAEMGLYSNKISQDGENMDQLGIQADIWRSKYHASRVQVDELIAQKGVHSKRYEVACTALEELLKERYQLRDSLFNTYRILQQLSDAFEPLPPTNRPASYAPKSVTDIADRNHKLADNMKFRLLGTIQLYPALYNTPTPNVMTAAEQMGIQALAEKPDPAESEESDVPSLQPYKLENAKFSRYSPHPYAKYDNVTFNCCRKCSGEIQIV